MFLCDDFAVLKRRDAEDGILRKRGKFECADTVGAECREMTKRQSPDFRRGLFVCERCGKIFPCELAVAGQDRPQKGANDLAEHKAHREGEPADHSDRAQCKPVNQAIRSCRKKYDILAMQVPHRKEFPSDRARRWEFSAAGSLAACSESRRAGWVIGSMLLSRTPTVPQGRSATWKSTRPTPTPLALKRFARQVDVISFEFENIPLSAINEVASLRPLRPRGEVLHICQNREREKAFLARHGFPHAPFAVVDSPESLGSSAGENRNAIGAEDSGFRIRRKRSTEARRRSPI